MKDYNHFYFGEKLNIGPVNTYVCEGGQLWLWGNNAYGQLGTNNVLAYSSPVQTVCGGSDWCMFDMGTYHTAAIKTDGSLWTWGLNLDGQLGDGTSVTKSSPVQEYYNSTDWTCCAAGYNFTIASKNDNSLWGMGFNNVYQLGGLNIVSQSQPVVIPLVAAAGWRKVSAGKYHAAALDYDGVLYLWGGNSYGQCGSNTVDIVSFPSYPYADTIDFIDIVCGEYFTLGVAYDNSVWAWGRNDQGQLGNISVGNISSPVQILSSYQIWAHVAASVDSSAAMAFIIASTPTPTTTNQPTPTPFGTQPTPTPSGTEATPTPTMSPTATISPTNTPLPTASATPTPTPSGTETTPTPTESPSATLSPTATPLPTQSITPSPTPSSTETTPTPTSSETPIPSATLTPTPSASLAPTATPIPTASGVTPTPTPSDTAATSTATPTPSETSVLNTPTPTPTVGNFNFLYTWGRNNYGQIGNDTQSFVSSESNPVLIPNGISQWQQVSQGGSLVAAIRADKSLWLWGRNDYGQLGNDSTVNQSSPVQEITGSINWSYVSTNTDITGGVKNDGSLWMWGNNSYGSIGDISTTNRSSPVQIGTGVDWYKLNVGFYLTVGAVKSNGTLWLWGANGFGQIGNNTSANSYSSPVQETGAASDWADISFGFGHAVGLKKNGTIWCWGANYAGQLGNGTIDDSSSPIQEITFSTWLVSTAGLNHSAAIRSDNTLWIWGANYEGQLGLDMLDNRSVAVQVGTDVGWVFVSAGSANTAAIKNDGSLWMWGLNDNGYLGNNTIINFSSPIQVSTYGNSWIGVEAGSAALRNAPLPTSTPAPT